MHAQRVPFRHAGVLEILPRVAHADAFHHRPRAGVAQRGERHHLGQAQLLETHLQTGSSPFTGHRDSIPIAGTAAGGRAPVRLLTNSEGRQAYRVVIASGVVAYVAVGIDPALMRALVAKLEKKLVKSGHMSAADAGTNG